MLFNSYIFLLVFFPITIVGFLLFGRTGSKKLAILWLVICSLFFYAWWNPLYVWLLICSILFNYSLGKVISRYSNDSWIGKWQLGLGIFTNLFLLGYYKYTNFFVSELNALFDFEWSVAPILLPLAISFFTFQQIAYLVDSYRGETKEHSFLHYCLFVAFFPQLIAGPIVRHNDIFSQFSRNCMYRWHSSRFSAGLTVFSIGLFKKVVIADEVAKYATPVFEEVGRGTLLSFCEAWGCALAYTLQIYFDFSGYSDMAIGLAGMIGLHLPLNFFSPYKARSIIDFWRRWHITLSHFLRDYVYFSLGGNRRGIHRRHINILATMVLGGLWHGANWTFVIWGSLHGLFLLINHSWRNMKLNLGKSVKNNSFFERTIISGGVTFIAVVVSFVFFRAESVDDAVRIVSAMIGGNGISLFSSFKEALGETAAILADFGIVFHGLFPNNIVDWYRGGAIIAILLCIVWIFPNTYQLMRRYELAINTYGDDARRIYGIGAIMAWKPKFIYAVATGILLGASLIVIGAKQDVSEFLYFQF